MDWTELLEIEKKNKKEADARKEFLKQKDWFVIVPANKIHNDRDLKNRKITFRLSILNEALDNLENDYDIKTVQMDCKFVYRTNSWFEKLPEINY